MKDQTKVDIITYVGIILIFLAAVGVTVFFATLPGPPPDLSECAEGAMALGNPSAPFTVSQALNDLVDEGAIADAAEAASEITKIGWILDPADDYRLEYWIELGANTAGFSVECITSDFDFRWEYDGLQDAP